jgi:hypothetical protein
VTGPGRRGPATAGLSGEFLLAGLVAAFALVTDLPWPIALTVGLGGVGATLSVRRWGQPLAVELAPGPVLVSLGVLAITAPSNPIAALLGGGCGLAILVCLADDPAREVGGPRRAGSTMLVVALAFGIAWGSALLLPPASGALGIAGGLLALTLFLIASLLRRPQLLEAAGTAIP